MKKVGVFKIKALSNFRGKIGRKIGKVDIFTNLLRKSYLQQATSSGNSLFLKYAKPASSARPLGIVESVKFKAIT